MGDENEDFYTGKYPEFNPASTRPCPLCRHDGPHDEGPEYFCTNMHCECTELERMNVEWINIVERQRHFLYHLDKTCREYYIRLQKLEKKFAAIDRVVGKKNHDL